MFMVIVSGCEWYVDDIVWLWGIYAERVYVECVWREYMWRVCEASICGECVKRVYVDVGSMS